MKKRIGTVAVGLAAVAALIAVPAAMAAYTSPKLEVTQTRDRRRSCKASLDPNDDPTARVAHHRPDRHPAHDEPGAGDGARTGQGDRQGARPRGRGSPARRTARRRRAGADPGCDRDAVPRRLDAACDVGDGAVGGRSDACRCRPTSSRPQGHRPLQARRSSRSACLHLTFRPAHRVERRSARRCTAPSSRSTVCSARSTTGAWISTWVPYTPGKGTANPAGVVVAPAAIAPGAVTLSAKTSGKGAIVTGSVTQAGQPRGGATVTIVGGSTKAKLTTRKKVKSRGEREVRDEVRSRDASSAPTLSRPVPLRRRSARSWRRSSGRCRASTRP